MYLLLHQVTRRTGTMYQLRAVMIVDAEKAANLGLFQYLIQSVAEIFAAPSLLPLIRKTARYVFQYCCSN